MNSFEKLADDLSAAGLWSRLPAAVRAAAMEAVRRGEYPPTAAYDDPDDDLFAYFVDGEEMSEGGVEEFLREVSPAMAEAGVPLSVATGTAAGDAYVVTINGEDCVVLENSYEADWLEATMRPLRHLNRLLARTQSGLRWHVLSPGENDGWAFLIEPRVALVMARSGLFSASDVPVEVV
jgi:hypothetical protein